MHLPMDPNASPLPVDLDYKFIARALLHSLGMGAVLMAVTGWVDGKQLKDASKQSNLQNSSNVLFMCVAIATVIILVGNNVARAFALGAAIALIRFKMKLGESSSGSGLLFAILCGMSSAVGLHPVGWTLAIGYSVIQIGLCYMSLKLGAQDAQAIALQNAIAAHSTSAVLVADQDMDPQEVDEETAEVPAAMFQEKSSKSRVTLMALTCLALAQFPGGAEAAECKGSYHGSQLSVNADHAYHAETVVLLSQPYATSDCGFEKTPVFENPFGTKESYSIDCTKYTANGISTAYYETVWEKSLVGERFNLNRRGFFVDRVPAELLLTQSVMGNLSLHIRFRLPEYDYAGIVDLSPSPTQQWHVEWVLSGAAAATVSCNIKKI